MKTHKPSRFVRMFKPRFAALVAEGKKLQTVRPIPHRMPKPGDLLSLREWCGAPYRSKQRVIREAVVESVRRVTINYGFVQSIEIDGTWLTNAEEDAFAVADGFASFLDMFEWFSENHGLPFKGIVIAWKNKDVA